MRVIQHKHGYLPAEQLQTLSKSLNIPLYQINGVAEFYPEFRVSPPAQAMVEVCTDMTCHLYGADNLFSDLEQRFAKLGKRAVEVHRRSCLGQCDFAPALTINEIVYRNVTTELAENHIQARVAGIELPLPVFENQPVALLADPYRGQPKYGALRALFQSGDWNSVIGKLKDAGLPGMGGAGFPTSIKWDAVKKCDGDEKYVVCNADESEPGTIKDRFIMTHLPHLTIEGMIVCAMVVGAQKGFLYIRHEYKEQEAVLEEEIKGCYLEGLLGNDILGSGKSFDLEIFVSPGGYICGEGSAQLEAIEGKRAEPRNKPPNSATNGLWQKPTALNNVETFANVPQILANGVEWFKSQGRDGTSGLKFVGVSGDVQRPGVFEVPMGIPVSEAIIAADGQRLQGAPTGCAAKSALNSSLGGSGLRHPTWIFLRHQLHSLHAAGTCCDPRSVGNLSSQI